MSNLYSSDRAFFVVIFLEGLGNINFSFGRAAERIAVRALQQEITQLNYNLGASNKADSENADEGKAALRDRVKRQHNQEKRCKHSHPKLGLFSMLPLGQQDVACLNNSLSLVILSGQTKKEGRNWVGGNL